MFLGFGVPLPLSIKREYEKEYRRAYRVWRWLEEHGYGLVRGLPGGGKSTYVLLALRWHRGPAVFAVPLRDLRDQLYARIRRDPRFKGIRNKTVVVKAHDEICPSLAARLREEENYFKALAEHAKASEEGREECRWRQQVRAVMEIIKKRREVLLLTTHIVGFMIMMLTWTMRRARRHTLFIFDEAEELLVDIGERIWLKQIEEIRYINEKLYKRLKRYFSSPNERMEVAWIPEDLVRFVLNNSVFISASFPPVLLEEFEKVDDDYPVYPFKQQRERDIIVLYEKILPFASYSSWAKELHPLVLDIVRVSRAGGWAVGIVSRNETQSNDLKKLLEGAGFKVWSDHVEKNDVDYRYADAVIIRPQGRGYRGYNFFTEINKDKKVRDYKVIVGFYQGKGIDRADVHPFFYKMLSDAPVETKTIYHPEDDDQIGDLIEQLLHARNFQSIFRFNRFRDHSHLVILLDWRYWKTFQLYAPTYFYKQNVLRFGDVEALKSVVLGLIKSL